MTETHKGPGFRLLSADVVDLTPDVLGQFRKLDASATERNLEQSRIKFLSDKVTDGLAVSFRWATAKLNGTTIRINGQHSSLMLEQLLTNTGHLPIGLKVLREHFEVDDLDSVALLFQQYDSRRSTRDADDIAGVYQAINEELADVPRPIAKLAIEAYAWYVDKVEGIPNVPRGDARYEKFSDTGLHPYIKWLGELHSVKTQELLPTPVMAAAYGTFEGNESVARKFWDEVSRGGDPDNDTMPERVLDKWLIEMNDTKNRPEGWKSAYFYQGCIYGWNAHREGRSINSIRYEVKKSFSPIK